MKDDDYAFWFFLWWIQGIIVVLELKSGVSHAGALGCMFGLLFTVVDVYVLEKMDAFSDSDQRFKLAVFFGIFIVGLLALVPSFFN